MVVLIAKGIVEVVSNLLFSIMVDNLFNSPISPPKYSKLAKLTGCPGRVVNGMDKRKEQGSPEAAISF